jgi:hypothetical protein
VPRPENWTAAAEFTVLRIIRKFLGSIMGPDAKYREQYFHGFLLFPSAKCWARPRRVPSTSFEPSYWVQQNRAATKKQQNNHSICHRTRLLYQVVYARSARDRSVLMILFSVPSFQHRIRGVCFFKKLKSLLSCFARNLYEVKVNTVPYVYFPLSNIIKLQLRLGLKIYVSFRFTIPHSAE